VNTTPVEVNDVNSKRELLAQQGRVFRSGPRVSTPAVRRSRSLTTVIRYTTGKSFAPAASSYASSGGTLLTSYFGTTDVSTVTRVLDVSFLHIFTIELGQAVANENGITSTTNICFYNTFFEEQADPSALCSGT
jgi:hypothetical protein